MFWSFNLFSQTLKDSMVNFISSGSVSTIVSLVPLTSGVATIMDAKNPKEITQSYVFFSVGIILNVESFFSFRKVEKMKETGDFGLLTKKERINIEKEVVKLEKTLGGIKEMRKLPGALFVIDPNNERIAILEANNLGIPVVAITDTNCDPTGVDYVVPGNDDAIKSVSMFTEYFANSVSEGMAIAKKNNKLTKDKDVSRDVALEKEIISKYEKDIDLADEE